MQNLKNLGLNKIQDNSAYFDESLKYLDDAAMILSELSDNDFLIQVYQLIGTIFEFLGNMDQFIYYFNKAIDIAVKNNIFGKKISMINKLVQKQAKLGKHEENIKILKDILQEINNIKLVDLYTIANFHSKLGESLIKIGNKEQGIKELIEAHQIFKTFQTPVYDDLLLLSQIVNFFTEMKDFEKISNYGEDINKISKQLHEISIQKPKLFSPLLTIREIWIYSTSTGVTLFSYAPETQVDQDLLGGLLTAIQQFSLELSQKEFDSMIIGSDLYMSYKENNMEFAILGRASTKTPPELAKKILSIMYKRFWKEYAPSINDFKGDITPFATFKDILESLDLTLEM